MRRTFWTALVCAVPLLVPPAGAAPVERLRLVANGTAYVDVSLPGGVRLDEVAARFVVHRGTYAAWWAVRLGERLSPTSSHAGGVRWVDPADGPATYPWSGFGFRKEPLAGGRYRVYVATDGAATIDVPAPGLGRGVELRPTRRTVAVSRMRTVPVVAGVVADDHREAVRPPPAALAVVTVRAVARPGVAVRSLTACLGKAGSACDQGASAYGYTSSLEFDHGTTLSSIYLPGSVPAGQAEVVQRAYGGPGMIRAAATVFWLTTVP